MESSTKEAEFLDGIKTHDIEESELLNNDIYEEFEADMIHIDATDGNKFKSKPADN
jgi:hypothetical protein